MNNVFYSNRTNRHFCIADMNREVQFLLYNMPEDSGKVQAVIKDEAGGTWRRKPTTAIVDNQEHTEAACLKIRAGGRIGC